MPRMLVRMRDDLGVEIESPFELDVDGRRLRFDALVRRFGARVGMLIDRESKAFQRHGGQLVALGYGYSCFDFAGWVKSDYNRESSTEMLSDWGCSGPAEERPEWVIDLELEE